MMRLASPALTLGLAATLLVPAGTAAQPAPATPGFTQDLPEADFLFERPRATLSLRAGLIVPAEGSDLFAFVQRQLTVDPGAFRTPAFTAEVAVALGPRLDLVGGIDLARKWVDSEYRDFVDNNLQPIEQQSLLRQHGLTAALRLALAPRGRQIGRFAWIPARAQPYVGAGGGLVFWAFEQTGDFVDFQDFAVFTDTFRASGIAPSLHALAGADIVIHKRLMLNAEGRYQWARGRLAGDFIGFEPLDLAGLRAMAGLSIAF